MNVKKINDNLIEITIPEEELCFDYDLFIEDMLDASKRNEISKKLIKIVQDVSEKEKIEMKNGMQLDVTVNEMHELILTVKFVPEFNLNNIHGIAKYIKTAIHNKPKEEAEEIMQIIFSKLNLSTEEMDQVLDEMNCIDYQEIEIEQEIKEFPSEELTYIIKTSTLDRCISLSKIIINIITESSLYKHKDEYYLILKILPDTDEFLLGMISEFLFENLHSMLPAFLNEHGQVIIKEDAIKILAKL